MTQGSQLIQWLVGGRLLVLYLMHAFFIIYFKTRFHSLNNWVGSRVTGPDRLIRFGFDNLGYEQ